MIYPFATCYILYVWTLIFIKNKKNRLDSSATNIVQFLIFGCCGYLVMVVVVVVMKVVMVVMVVVMMVVMMVVVVVVSICKCLLVWNYSA